MKEAVFDLIFKEMRRMGSVRVSEGLLPDLLRINGSMDIMDDTV